MANENVVSKKKPIIIGSIIGVVVIAAILFFALYEKPSYENYVSKGQELLTEEKYEDAIDSFNKALEMDPDGIEAFIGLSDGYIGLEEYAKAIKKLSEAKGVDDSNPLVYDRLVTANVGSENIEDANKVVLEVIEKKLPTDDITSVKPAPKVKPEGGKFDKGVNIEVESVTEGAIYYTLNGKIPTTKDKKYENPITIDDNGEHKFVAVVFQDNGLMGFPAENTFTLNIESNYEDYLGTWEVEGLILKITSVDGNKVGYYLKKIWGMNYSDFSGTGTVENDVLKFNYTDSGTSKGYGSLTFGSNAITLDIHETENNDVLDAGFGTFNYTFKR